MSKYHLLKPPIYAAMFGLPSARRGRIMQMPNGGVPAYSDFQYFV